MEEKKKISLLTFLLIIAIIIIVIMAYFIYKISSEKAIDDVISESNSDKYVEITSDNYETIGYLIPKSVIDNGNNTYTLKGTTYKEPELPTNNADYELTYNTQSAIYINTGEYVSITVDSDMKVEIIGSSEEITINDFVSQYLRLDENDVPEKYYVGNLGYSFNFENGKCISMIVDLR